MRPLFTSVKLKVFRLHNFVSVALLCQEKLSFDAEFLVGGIAGYDGVKVSD